MSISWLEMDKMSDKMRQGGAKRRKMEDVSSVLGPLGGHEGLPASNSAAGRGPGEVPPLGRVNPPPGRTSNPDSHRFAIKVRVSRGTSSKFGGSPS